MNLFPSISSRRLVNLMHLHYWDLPGFPPNVVNLGTVEGPHSIDKLFGETLSTFACVI